MREITIRVDLSDKVVRSTNDVPGVICFALDEDGDVAFSVSDSWLPSEGTAGVELVPEGSSPEETTLTVKEVVEGCADEQTEDALWELVVLYGCGAIPNALQNGNLRFAHACLDFIDDVAVEMFLDT